MSRATEQEEIAVWLRQRAIPLTRIEAGGESEDLHALKTILKGVRIAGFGESTHGTREFFELRHRLLRFLVIEMGFNALAIEGSHLAAQAINEYVLHGVGDRPSLLTELRFVMWDVQEFADVLDWLREYNRCREDLKKVRFYGLDNWHPRSGSEEIVDNLARSRCMAENLVRIAEQGGPQAKLVVWAHIYHLGIGFEDPPTGKRPNMGQRLQERWGQQYYVFGLELNRGSYLARDMLSNADLGELRIIQNPPAVPGTLPAYLSRIGERALLLDLRESILAPAVEEWLRTRQSMHMLSWGYCEPPIIRTEVIVKEYCDGIIFIEDTSPTTPTPNALRAVAERRAH